MASFQNLWSWFALPWVLAIGACAKDPTPAPQLSDQCITCLTKTLDGGCAQQWSACDQLSSCSDFAVCQMQALCYTRPREEPCESAVGCLTPPVADAGDANDPLHLSAAFEDCARTTCRTVCGFVGP